MRVTVFIFYIYIYTIHHYNIVSVLYSMDTVVHTIRYWLFDKRVYFVKKILYDIIVCGRPTWYNSHFFFLKKWGSYNITHQNTRIGTIYISFPSSNVSFNVKCPLYNLVFQDYFNWPFHRRCSTWYVIDCNGVHKHIKIFYDC